MVTGICADLGRLRKMVVGLGGEIEDPPAMITGEAAKAAACLHYFGWLEVDPGDRSPTRGHNLMTKVKCVNCGKTWPSCAELLVAMKGEMDRMWSLVLRCAGRLGLEVTR
jgi:hypothetical protein